MMGEMDFFSLTAPALGPSDGERGVRHGGREGLG